MKILQTKAAPNPRRVRIFLAEKGIAVPFEEVDIMRGALKTPEFSAINRFQRVPVLLLDDGTAIAETIAICRYFEELQPLPALFGKGPLGCATVEMWSRRMDLGLMLSVVQAFRHLHPAMASLEVPQVAAWGEANKPRALEILVECVSVKGKTNEGVDAVGRGEAIAAHAVALLAQHPEREL